MELRYYVCVRYMTISQFNPKDDGKDYKEIWIATTDNPDDIYDRDLEDEVYTVYDGKIDNQPDSDEWDDFMQGEEWFIDEDCLEWDDCFKSEEEALKRAKEVAVSLSTTGTW